MPARQSQPVETAAGAVRGLADGEARSFLGIPYARATRLAPPEAPEGWSGVLDATAVGPAAPQPERPVGLIVFGALGPTAEQCLSLNVWAPAAAGPARPVIVFLHGGGFTIGSGGAPISNGHRLAVSADAVVVTINYRLGSPGWLYHRDLDDRAGEPAGNWGLLDQLAALRWVRDNIGPFGGDSAAVTLMGQSAGALSIIDLLGLPAAEGLFARAIVQSPPMADAVHEPELGERWAEALSTALTGRAGFDAEALRAAPPQELVRVHEELLAGPDFRGTRGGALPIRDGVVIPESPLARPAASPGVDVLLGTTAGEGAFFFRAAGRGVDPDDEELLRIAARLPGVSDAAAAVAHYGGDADNAEALVRIATQAMVAVPAADWATARASAGARVHRYRVDHRSPHPGWGALHTIDVPLVFGTYEDDPGSRELCGGDGATAAVSAAMQGAVRAFVRGEDPGWPALTGDGEHALAVFGGDAPVAYASEPRPRLHPS